MLKNSVWLLLFALAACTGQKSQFPHVEIRTKFGDIELELYTQQAPVTTAAFLRYVDSGLYDNASFYRILNTENQPSNAPKSELIQGGIWGSNYKRLTKLPGIAHETTQQTKLLHTDGTISLARQEPGTARSEFFICIGDQPGYDYGGENNPDGQGYAAFGRVVKGRDVVTKIFHAPENDQYFDPQVSIYSIKRL
ncbi:peptidylprolyl isomerase [Foetidibacter luteolus]|uniref:peptidylprolyl isomerase n=1 Tax=Foetidibacter luteolus TaxID=2608880 RepID=UPI00129A94AD|nr:peptidylprolyl isomerase [Foetidibacter luteolus]